MKGQEINFKSLAIISYKLVNNVNILSICSVGGIMVSIAAFQAVDPGSIPGHRIVFITIFNLFQISREFSFL